MNARLRRLNADYELAQRAFANHPYISLVQTEGTPPEKYTFAIRVENISKQYKIGTAPGKFQYGMLRDQIVDAAGRQRLNVVVGRIRFRACVGRHDGKIPRPGIMRADAVVDDLFNIRHAAGAI